MSYKTTESWTRNVLRKKGQLKYGKQANTKRGKIKLKNFTRNVSFLSRYGLTFTEYRKKLKECSYRCNICGYRSMADLENYRDKLDLQVDHCHGAGIIRGLLCGRCNSGLGFFKDSPKSLRAAADYLEKFGCSAVCEQKESGINTPPTIKIIKPNGDVRSILRQ